MKKITLITASLIIFGAIATIAQPVQGRLLLSASSSTDIYGVGLTPSLGSFTIHNQIVKSDDKELEKEYEENNENDKTRSFNLTPRVGYMLTDNIACGLSYTHFSNFNSYTSKITITGPTGFSEYSYTTESRLALNIFSPFVRFYVPVSKFSLFADIEAGLGSIQQNETTEHPDDQFQDEDDHYASKVRSMTLSLGAAIPLADRINLDLALTYNRLGIEEEDDNPDNTRYINISYGAKLGFTIFLFN